VHTLITDNKIDDASAKMIKSYGVELITVDV
jgi:DeoR/GlpR family transcriptional regulator of sugar metabolism